MAAAIPGSREVFPDAGHGVFRDKAAEALTVIRDFVLDGTDTSTGLGLERGSARFSQTPQGFGRG